MRYRHHPALVRMFIPDQSWHCAVHGRLEPDEANELMMRLRMSEKAVLSTESVIRRSVRLQLQTALDHLLWMLRRPKCEPLS